MAETQSASAGHRHQFDASDQRIQSAAYVSESFRNKVIILFYLFSSFSDSHLNSAESLDPKSEKSWGSKAVVDH